MIKGLKLLNIFLVLAGFPVASILFKDYLVYKSISEKGTVQKVSRPIPQPASHSLMSYAPVMESAVFPSSSDRLTQIEVDEEAAKTADTAKKADTAPVTKDLSLHGTITGTKGYAVFEDKAAKKEEIFKLGDKVFEAGVLKKVSIDTAVLSYDGVNELSFTIGAENIQPPPIPRQAQPQPSAASPLSQRVGENEWVLDQRAILKALEDMNQVLTDARLTPNMAGGKVEGFQVREIKPRGIFDAIGLKNGDVLIKVNGYEIDAPEKAVQVISSLRGETMVDLNLIRNGQRMSFHYQIR
jgi:general secretion pathway protein C